MMSDIGSICHYFVYEPALKYSLEVKLLREMKSCGDIVRYEHSYRKEKQFCMRHYQMITYPSTNPIWRSLTSRTTLLDHRSIQRFTDLSVWQGLISWRGRECKTFMTHISSSVYKYSNSPTPSILRIVSKPATATREYRKKVLILRNTCNVDSCTHWVPIFELSLRKYNIMITEAVYFWIWLILCSFSCRYHHHWSSHRSSGS